MSYIQSEIVVFCDTTLNPTSPATTQDNFIRRIPAGTFRIGDLLYVKVMMLREGGVANICDFRLHFEPSISTYGYRIGTGRLNATQQAGFLVRNFIITSNTTMRSIVTYNYISINNDESVIGVGDISINIPDINNDIYYKMFLLKTTADVLCTTSLNMIKIIRFS